MPYQIITAAAAVVANMVRMLMDQPIWSQADQASTIPMITPKLVEQLAYAGATDAEIADRFLLDESVISNDYRPVLRVARAVRRMQLRGAQFTVATKGNASLLTWLGRNELGQSLNPTNAGEPMPREEE